MAFSAWLFQLARCFGGVTTLHLIVQRSNIPLPDYATCCLSIHLSVDMWLVSTYWRVDTCFLFVWFYADFLVEVRSRCVDISAYGAITSSTLLVFSPGNKKQE